MRELPEIEADLAIAVEARGLSCLKIGNLLNEAKEIFGVPIGGSGNKKWSPFKDWAQTKTGLAWSTCREYMKLSSNPISFQKSRERTARISEIANEARMVFSQETARSVVVGEERRQRRIAFVVDAAFYLSDDEWSEALELIVERRSQKVAA